MVQMYWLTEPTEAVKTQTDWSKGFAMMSACGDSNASLEQVELSHIDSVPQVIFLLIEIIIYVEGVWYNSDFKWTPPPLR